MARVSLISLGCPKNLVDSEGALGEIVQAGHNIESDDSRADVIIVNTCGFIESARAESIDTILEALDRKESGEVKAVMVIGCMAQKFATELANELPGVDAFLGVAHAGRLTEAIAHALEGKSTLDVRPPEREWIEHTERVQSTPPWTAYLKISDGCDNRCAYCAIPDIRGPFRSRSQSAICDEARKMADRGVKEVILVGQDLTQYGADRGEADALPGLLRSLNKIEALRWIRLLYCYPTKVTPDLIDAVATCERVVKYMDIPIQHGDDAILKSMNRRGSSGDYLRMIDSLREACTDIALRTSFIVGFPGETQEAYENLVEFARRIDFDRVGVFAYSREEGTPAAGLGKRVSKKIAADRVDKLMRMQMEISLAKNQKLVGRTLDVLIEGRTEDGAFGRSYRDAPDIDGLVYIDGQANMGDIVPVRITGAQEYDLIGSLTQ